MYRRSFGMCLLDLVGAQDVIAANCLGDSFNYFDPFYSHTTSFFFFLM